MTDEIKLLAKELGAGAVGITRVTQDALYKGGKIEYKNAIVILYPMNHEEMRYVTQDRAGTETMRAYMEISKQQSVCLKKIRKWDGELSTVKARIYCISLQLMPVLVS